MIKKIEISKSLLKGIDLNKIKAIEKIDIFDDRLEISFEVEDGKKMD